jgi:Na+/H+-dicarboxylate symporter
VGAAKNFGIAILVLMFIIGLGMAIYGFIAENTRPITDRLDASMTKFYGVIIMIIPIGIFFGISSGTGRPYGGGRYKGLGGY